MNIKRIGLIGGSGVVGGGTNSGSGGSEDNLWEITDINNLQHHRYNAAITIGSSIVTSHIGKNNTDVIDISADEGIQIERNYQRLIEISPGVSIGTGSDKNKSVFIGTGVYIEDGFDSRNIGGGNTEDSLWNYNKDEGMSVRTADVNISLGTDVKIGTNTIVQLGKHVGIIVGNGSSEDIFIGTNVYIETGFDSRNISGGSSGSGDGLWKVEGDLLTSKSPNRNIQLGTEIFIGTSGSVTIEGNLHGIQVYTDSNQSAIVIGTKVKIGTSNESVEISQMGIQINDTFGDKSIFISSNVYINNEGIIIGTSSNPLLHIGSGVKIARCIEFEIEEAGDAGNPVQYLVIKNTDGKKYTKIELDRHLK